MHYDLHLDVPARKADRVTGEIVIRFRLSDASRQLVLDYAADPTDILAVNDVPPVMKNGHVVLPASALKQGIDTVRIRFRAGNASLNRNDDFLYTLFVPARASLAIPVFDQPNLKARWTLTLTVPHDWQAVANGPERSRRADPAAPAEAPRDIIEFAETARLPTYLFGFAAGKWQIETAARMVGEGPNARQMSFRMLHRETDTVKVARNRDSIFDLVARSVTYMERYTGIVYPFAKYDFVAVPSFQFGGMEHAGAVLYNASSLFLEESATQNQKLNRASLIAHESAHMWFGDLVTMRWFDDVWLKEVMAKFIAAKIVQPSFPEVNHRLRFLLEHYDAAYEVDRTAGTHPIRQQLANLNEAAQLYGAIIYEKAPVVMAQLEQLVGEEPFRDGMRAYLRTHAYGNASFADMIVALDPFTPEDLRTWSRMWVEESGRPEIRVARNPGSSIEFRQRDPAGRNRIWNQPTSVALIYPDTVRFVPLHLDARIATMAQPAQPPLAIVPNGDGRAYGLFLLDDRSRAWLLSNVQTLHDAVLRGAVWLDLWDALLEGRIAAPEFADVALRALAHEPDEQLTALILGDFGEVYWRYLSETQRVSIAPHAEQILRDQLAAAPTSSRKAAYFAALRSVTLTDAGLARLRSVWQKADSVPGLRLGEDDYTALASSLVLRGATDPENILNVQAARITNPDRRARFEFVRPALSRDAHVRDAWFNALRKRENRAREAWVAEGLADLNHPLRADSALHYIRPALDMLAEVRATGDIFFPKRWLDATLSGHSSPAAAAIVREFLAAHPDYPVRLRQIVLQSADPLFRAARRR